MRANQSGDWREARQIHVRDNSGWKIPSRVCMKMPTGWTNNFIDPFWAEIVTSSGKNTVRDITSLVRQVPVNQVRNLPLVLEPGVYEFRYNNVSIPANHIIYIGFTVAQGGKTTRDASLLWEGLGNTPTTIDRGDIGTHRTSEGYGPNRSGAAKNASYRCQATIHVAGQYSFFVRYDS